MVLNRATRHPIPAGLLATGLLMLPLGMPLLTPIQMAVPLPLLLVALRCGKKAGWMAAAIPVGGAIALGGGFIFPIMVFLVFAGFALLSAWLLRSGWSIRQCASVAFLIGMVVLTTILLWALFSDADPQSRIIAGMNIVKVELLKAVSTTEGVDALALATFQSELDQFINLLGLLFPAFIITGWFLIHVANLVMVRSLLNRWGEDRIRPEKMADFRLPFFLVWTVIIMVALGQITEGKLHYLSVNLGLFLAVPYFFQGLAVVRQAFQHHKINGFWRGVFFATLIFWTGLVLLVLMLGLFDTWIDFRHRFFINREGQPPSGS